MKILVTGSSGHLGEALVRTLQIQDHDVMGLDLLPSPHTHVVGSITDRESVRQCLEGVDTILHTATLHKPHIVTHPPQDFIDTNITGTLILLEEAIRAGINRFIFTSTTSVFGHALRPPQPDPAVWVTEQLHPIPRNIYGITKVAAEDLCYLFHRKSDLPCLILRTSRFFPEADDDATIRQTYSDANAKANEFPYRRVDLEDVVQAHLCAIDRAPSIGFDRFIISATTPFLPEDVVDLRDQAPQVLERRVPGSLDLYKQWGWQFFPSLDRVYDNTKARSLLGWHPRYDFPHVLRSLQQGQDPRSPLARQVGAKGYHAQIFKQGPYPVESDQDQLG